MTTPTSFLSSLLCCRFLGPRCATTVFALLLAMGLSLSATENALGQATGQTFRVASQHAGSHGLQNQPQQPSTILINPPVVNSSLPKASAGGASMSRHSMTSAGSYGRAPLHDNPVYLPSQPVRRTLLPCGRCYYGFDCRCGGVAGLKPWNRAYRVDFEQNGPGEYAGPARFAHMNHYAVRVGDTLQLTYSLSRRLMNGTYRIGIGDQLMLESQSDSENLNRGTLERGIEVQQDGTISVRIIGRVHAVGLTLDQLKELLEKMYKQFYNDPKIDVTPVRTNVTVEDIQSAIAGAGGFVEPSILRTITPDGNISLPKIGLVQVHGLGIEEIKQEINLRYQVITSGIEVDIAVETQAPRFVSVLGEVQNVGRFEMTGPTTVLTALALAGGRQTGANLRQIVVFRRADDWRLVATVLDLRQAILGKDPLPYDEIWLRDGDVVIVPTSPIQQFDNFVNMVFTQGIYGIVPFTGFDLVEAVSGFSTDNDN